MKNYNYLVILKWGNFRKKWHKFWNVDNRPFWEKFKYLFTKDPREAIVEAKKLEAKQQVLASTAASAQADREKKEVTT